jgi:hypothetical protein
LLRIAHHVQHPVQKQRRSVPNQRNGQAERLRNTRSYRLNRGNGFSEVEGKAARVAASERGQRASFNKPHYRRKAEVDLQNQFIGAAITDHSYRRSFTKVNEANDSQPLSAVARRPRGVGGNAGFDYWRHKIQIEEMNVKGFRFDPNSPPIPS